MNIVTTLNEIEEQCNPCEEGWDKLLSYLGKTKSDDEPLPLSVILESNGLKDAMWYLQQRPDMRQRVTLYAVWCVKRLSHLIPRPEVKEALELLEGYVASETSMALYYKAAWLVENVYQSDWYKNLVDKRVGYVPRAILHMVSGIVAEDAWSVFDLFDTGGSMREIDSYELRTERINKFREMFCTDEPQSTTDKTK